MTPPLTRLLPHSPARNFAAKTFWAILDQGLFSLSNFFLFVMLARWLEPAEFEVSSVTFAVFLLPGIVHSAFVTEPLLVLGSGRHRQLHHAYLPAVTRLHWWVALRLSAVTAVAGVALHVIQNSQLGAGLVAAASGMSFILMQWMLRQRCYVLMRPQAAALAGCLYFIVIVTGSFGMNAWGAVSAPSALILMAAASGVSITYMLNLEKISSTDQPTSTADCRRTAVWKRHWDYGRWSVIAMTLVWGSTEIFYLFLAFFHGFDSAGTARAAMNFIAPANQIIIALSTVSLPILSSALKKGSSSEKIAFLYFSVASFSIAYALFVFFAAKPLTDFAYGQRYDGVVTVLQTLAFLPIGAGIAAVSGNILRALEYPCGLLGATAVGALLAFTLGLALTFHFSAQGAAVSLVIINALIAFFLVFAAKGQVDLRNRN